MPSIADTYVTVLPETSKVADGIRRAFREVDKDAAEAGRRWGREIQAGIGDANINVDADTTKAKVEIDEAAKDRHSTIHVDVDRDRLGGDLISGLSGVAGGVERAATSMLTGAMGSAMGAAAGGMASAAADGMASVGQAVAGTMEQGISQGAQQGIGAIASVAGPEAGVAGSAIGSQMAQTLQPALMAGGIAAIAGIASSLSGLAGLIPAGVAGGGTVLGTLVVGLDGVKDAWDAASKAAAASGPEQAAAIEKMNQAMGGLAPSAQQFVQTLIGMKPVFDEFKRSVQESLFAGIGPEIQRLATTFMPILQTSLTQMAGLINQAFMGISAVLQQPQMVAAIQNIFNNINASFQAFLPTINTLTQAFVQMTSVGSQFLPQLGQLFDQLAQSFTQFISSGQFGQWISTGLQAFGQLIPIIEQLGQAFLALAPIGLAVLPALQQIIGALLPAVAPMSQAFAAMITAVSPILTLFAQLASTVMTALAPAFTQFFIAMAPVVQQLVGALAPVLPVIGAVLQQVGATLMQSVLAAIQALLPQLVPFVAQVGQLLIAVLPLVPALVNMGTSGLPLILGVITNILPVATEFTRLLTTLAQVVVPPLAGLLNGVAEALRAIFSALQPIIAPLTTFTNLLPQVPGFGGSGPANFGIGPARPTTPTPTAPVVPVPTATPPANAPKRPGPSWYWVNDGQGQYGGHWRIGTPPAAATPGATQLPTVAPSSATTGGLGLPGASQTYTIPKLQQQGIPPLYQNTGAGANVPDWVQQFVKQYGGPNLVANTDPHGSLHGTAGSAGYAVDVSGPDAELDNLARTLAQNPQLASNVIQLIRRTQSGQDIGIAGGQPVGPGTSAPGYFAKDFPQHAPGPGSHVHLALSGGGPQGMPTVSPTAAMPTAAAPSVTAQSSPQDIARYIYQAALARGYSDAEARAIVAYAQGESGLSPGISGGVQGDDEVIGLFQQKSGFARAGGIDPSQRGDPAANTTAYLNQLAAHRGKGDIYDQLLATSVGGPMYTGGRGRMRQLEAQISPYLQGFNPNQQPVPGASAATDYGTQSNPMYVDYGDNSQFAKSSTGGEQLGQDLVSGILEVFGFDGSVFKDPTSFGSFKFFKGFMGLLTGGGKGEKGASAFGGDGASQFNPAGDGGGGDFLGGIFQNFLPHNTPGPGNANVDQSININNPIGTDHLQGMINAAQDANLPRQRQGVRPLPTP